MTTLSKPACYHSDDRAEAFVRYLLMHNPDRLQNHSISSYTERGDTMPRMRETIPGQYNAVNGIDIFGLDLADNLWIIEVSRGVVRGAARVKGGGKPVKYAHGNLQMSVQWRTEAARKFLAEQANADVLLQILFSDTTSPLQALRSRFQAKMLTHRKAIVIPDGGHFDEQGTDIDFATEIYTCPFPAHI